MRRVKQLVDKIAPTDSAVLIQGETGTGKELVARRIHELSLRVDGPFVAVNCGALPENLVESEFFGHRKGAFTGADTPRKGLVEVAHCGTLFLDEIGDLDKGMQVMLLRFLESGEIRRVGENEFFHVDVRIVCATNRDLQTMVAEGTFREDLFFRVNTFEIHLSPLRERKEDIPSLARTLIARHLKRAQAPADILSPAALEVLLSHEWSGNVRELANALEHAVILSDGKTILPEHLPASVTGIGARSHSTGIVTGLGPGEDAARNRDGRDPPGARQARRRQAQGGPRTGDRPQDALQQAQPVPGQRRGRVREWSASRALNGPQAHAGSIGQISLVISDCVPFQERHELLAETLAAMVLGLVSHVFGDVRHVRLTDADGRVAILPREFCLICSCLIQPFRRAGLNGADNVCQSGRWRQPDEQVHMVLDRINFQG